MTLRVNAAAVPRRLPGAVAEPASAAAGPLAPECALTALRGGRPAGLLRGGPASRTRRPSSRPAAAAAPGERILDACAAPGARPATCWSCSPGWRWWRYQRRTAGPGKRESRPTGGGTVERMRPPPRVSPGRFDGILVDAPCSASGVIRRHPTSSCCAAGDIRSLAQQLAILGGLWPLLSRAATAVRHLLRVREENGDVVTRFLAGRGSLHRDPGPGAWRPARETAPAGPEGPDGLFFACWRSAAPA